MLCILNAECMQLQMPTDSFNLRWITLIGNLALTSHDKIVQ